MIEQALTKHLQAQEALLSPYLARFGGKLAIFTPEAAKDEDKNWAPGPQYGRLVFTVDLKGDPERTTGGTLAVDILCKKGQQFPDDIEPIVRNLIHGYFFSNGTFVVSAQWKNSNPFSEPTHHVIGCTVTFELLAFPVITTSAPENVVARLNQWTADRFPKIHVINHKPLPAQAWKPSGGESAVYWRCANERQAGWIPDTHQTIWRTAVIKGHIFSETPAEVAALSDTIIVGLYTSKRLLKPGEAPIMVNRNNTSQYGADPLRTGQLTVEATFGVIVRFGNSETIQDINLPKGDKIYGNQG